MYENEGINHFEISVQESFLGHRAVSRKLDDEMDGRVGIESICRDLPQFPSGAPRPDVIEASFPAVRVAFDGAVLKMPKHFGNKR